VKERRRLKGDVPANELAAMRLRVMRHRAGLTQRQLAARVGMKHTTYASREVLHGAHRLTFAELAAVTAACGITMPDFMSIEPTLSECIELNFDVAFWPADRR
jgi:transcriptional regulator with XRE-family HTH domain